MGNGLFVTGTDTEVGKTAVTAGLARIIAARSRLKVSLWKPVQSGAAPGDPNTDSRVLLRGSGLEAEEEIATYTFTPPLAPWMAARHDGQSIDFHRLVAEGRRRMKGGFLLAEGAGGLLVPLTAEQTIADLAEALGLPVLIVARPGLGTVNHTLLTVAEVRRRRLTPAGVVLNGVAPDQTERWRENAEMIERFGNVPVLGGLPWRSEAAGDTGGRIDWGADWAKTLERELDFGPLEKLWSR